MRLSVILREAGGATRFTDKAADVRRIEQQLAMYCGAACSAMVSSRYGVQIEQAAAYAAIHDPARFAVERLYSDPKGVSDFLRGKLVGTAVPQIETVTRSNFSDAVDAILYNVAFEGFPAAVLVQGGNHWVVVDTVRIAEDSSGSSQCAGVFIENPWFNQPSGTYHSIDEFEERWLTPNRWGTTWLNQIVVVGMQPPERRRALKFRMPRLRAELVEDPINAAIELSTAHGFADFSAASGGGGVVLAPISVTAEDGSGDFLIVPLDGTPDPTFSNFVYAALSGDRTRLLEITAMGAGLQIPDDLEAETAAKAIYPSAEIKVQPGVFWTHSFRCLSRFAVYKKILIDGEEHHLMSSGELVQDAQSPTVAGGN